MKAIFFLTNFFIRVSQKVTRLLVKFSKFLEPPGLHEQNVIKSTQYNMVSAQDEAYYAAQYMQFIRKHLEEISNPSRILDLGCSQGRFTLQLATLFPQASVIGCDISASAIASAIQSARNLSVSNVQLSVQSIAECLETIHSNTCDVIVMTEVTIFYPGWRDDFPKVIDCLKPGGLLIFSFRSRFFNALLISRNRLWDKVSMLLNCSHGRIFDCPVEFSWETSEDLRNLIVDKHKLQLIDLAGIGVLSGIAGDPHAHLVQPHHLSMREQQSLMQLELALAREVPDAGRYILVVARK